MFKRQFRLGLVIATLCLGVPMQSSAATDKTVIEKEHFLVECRTEIRRNEIVESALSFAIEVDIEKHTVQPDTTWPALATTIEGLHGALAPEASLRSLPRRLSDMSTEWSVWKIRNFGGTDTRSFGAIAAQHCSELCAMHRSQSLDGSIDFFAVAKPSNNERNVPWNSGAEITKLYPGSTYAIWFWTTINGGGEQFQFEISANKTVREVGSCKWSERKV